MKNLSIASLLACVIALSACSTQTAAVPQTTKLHEAVLIVALEDGSVIMQTISSNADFCFKSSSASSTTCLTQGAAIVSPDTNAIIGFEMIEDQIDLVAKTD